MNYMTNTIKQKLNRFVCSPIVLLLLFGFILRLIMAYIQPIWIDEASTWYIAKNTSVYNLLVGNYTGDPHPFLNFLIVKLLIELPITPAISIRLFSVICGSALVIVVYQYSKLYVTKKRALLVAFITSVSPIFIWYSAESRPYMPALFFSIVALLCWRRYQKNGQIHYVIVANSSIIIALFLSYSSALLILVMIIFSVLSKKKRVKQLLMLALSSLPIILWSIHFFMLSGKSSLEQTTWIGVPSWRDLLQYGADSFSFQWQRYLKFDQANMGTIALIVIQVVFVWELLVNMNVKSLYKTIRKYFGILLLPIGFTFIFSIYIKPIFLSRQLLLSCIGIYALLSTLNSKKLSSKLLLSIVMLLMFFSNIWNLRHPKTVMNTYYYDHICNNGQLQTIYTNNEVMYKYLYYLNTFQKCGKNIFMKTINNINQGECSIDADKDDPFRNNNEISNSMNISKKLVDEHFVINCKYLQS